MQVVDGQRHRGFRAPLLDQRHDRLDDWILRAAAPDQRQDLCYPPVAGRQRRQPRMHGRERQALVEFLRRAGHRMRKQASRIAEDRPQQQGLADTRFALDKDQLAPPRSRIARQPGQTCHLAVAAHHGIWCQASNTAGPGHIRSLAAVAESRNKHRQLASVFARRGHRSVARPAAATEFFVSAAYNLQEAGVRAGVRRAVAVSIINIDKSAGGYGLAKIAHVDAWRSGPIPVRIVRAAPSHEFVAQLLQPQRLPASAGALREVGGSRRRSPRSGTPGLSPGRAATGTARARCGELSFVRLAPAPRPAHSFRHAHPSPLQGAVPCMA